MKKAFLLSLLITILSLSLSGCGPSPTQTDTPAIITHTPTFVSPTDIPISPTSTTPSEPTTPPIPKGKTILVSSAEDSGPSTLDQAIRDAQPGDIITFDPQVFPPDQPTIIYLSEKNNDSALPNITQGNLTIDASDAGVILDGSNTSGDLVTGLTICSDGNTIRGLQIINFSGSGIALCSGSNNVIGGDRKIGSGPVGQGNLSSKNGIGIDLCDWGSNNIVTGNIIGTNAAGSDDWGNTLAGICIENGMTNNVLGPDNLIAFNTSNGIRITGSNADGNTITQNSIYENSIGIRISDEVNPKVDSPLFYTLDMDLGTVSGSACANCTIEFFSGASNQGKVFEGQVNADSRGFFTYEHGASFDGPLVTATATDAKGNTSEFPLILFSVFLQENNTHPIVRFQSKQSNELEDNRIGIHFTNLWQLEPEVFPEGELNANHILNQGVTRARLSITNIDSEIVHWDKPENSINPEHDEFITSLADNGITITYVLSFWDKEYVAQGGDVPSPRFKTEEEIQRYLDFVRFIVHHFKDRVEYYEIWNEPNIRWAPNLIQWIEVEDYINLVKRVVPVIRQEYPEAKIVVGGVSYTRQKDTYDYLLSILNSDDIMPLVDVVSWHGMYGTSPEYDFHRQYYYDYPSIVREIKETASAHGFNGEFVSDELSWLVPATPAYPETYYSETKCAKYYARGIIMHLGMDVFVSQFYAVPPGGHPMQIVNTIRNLTTVMAGNKPTNLPVTIQSEATIIKNYGFSLSNGDKMLAVWNDEPAVDFDPGISTTLVIPGFAGWNATAIDVLNGFEQELMTSSENGDLLISDFLLMDYPIIIRLSK